MTMAKPFWDKDELVGTIQRNGREEIQVRRVAKDGREYVDVRTFYPGHDGAMRPGRGIALPLATASDVAALVRQAVSDDA